MLTLSQLKDGSILDGPGQQHVADQGPRLHRFVLSVILEIVYHTC